MPKKQCDDTIRMQNLVMSKEPDGAINLYQDTDRKHYDDAIMRKAVQNVRPYFENTKYNLLTNNCQNFTHSVVAEYYRIMGEETPSLRGHFK